MIGRADERGGIVVGWLVKLVLGIAIFGAAVFEAGAVVVARVNVDRISIDAADEAGLEYGRTRSSTEARREAENVAERNGAELIDFSISRNRDTVQVTVRKQASTLFIHRLGPLERYAVAEASHSGAIR